MGSSDASEITPIARPRRTSLGRRRETALLEAEGAPRSPVAAVELGGHGLAWSVGCITDRGWARLHRQGAGRRDGRGPLVEHADAFGVDADPTGLVALLLDPAGFVDTPLAAALLGDQLEARRHRLRSSLPIGRVVGPADVAALAVRLMTNTAVSGATFDIDGGQQLVER